MIARFCAYAALRNLRLFEHFFVLFLLHSAGLGLGAVGALLALEKAIGAVLEVPLGAIGDALGRRRVLALAFVLLCLACALFGVGASAGAPLWWIVPGQAVLAVSDALRSGTHKAMILDWLTERDEAHRRTAVIARTRTWSKSSSGVSALLAGLLVWALGDFTALFWLTLVPAAATVALVLSYPKALDGGRTRRRRAGESRQPVDPRTILARPGLWSLLLASVLFESQVKLSLHFLQPLLETGLAGVDLTVVGGVGGVVYGAYQLVSGLLAGGAARLAPRLERAFGTPRGGLTAAHVAAGVTLAVAATTLGLGRDTPVGLLLALAAMLGMAALQNARRPLFVATLDTAMDPDWRATTLSIERQARAMTYAATAALFGGLGEGVGLWAAFAGMAALVIGAAVVGAGRPTGGRTGSPSPPDGAPGGP